MGSVVGWGQVVGGVFNFHVSDMGRFDAISKKTEIGSVKPSALKNWSFAFKRLHFGSAHKNRQLSKK